MKKKLYRFLAIFMSAALGLAPVIPVLAQEYGFEEQGDIIPEGDDNPKEDYPEGRGDIIPEGDDTPDPPFIDPVPKPDPIPKPPEGEYKLVPSKSRVSFESMVASTQPKSERLELTNVGNAPANLSWTLIDPDNVFSLDINGTSVIPAGGSAAVYVVADVLMARPGVHYGTLLLGDSADVGFTKGTTIDLVVQVVDNTPVVKGIEITPSNPMVTPGGSVSFRASVWGDNITDTGVVWYVDGASTSGTGINTGGVLTISPNESSQSLTVKAVPFADKNKSASVRVNITRNKYTVSVKASPKEGGYVNGGATVDDNARVSIVAGPNNGWNFRYWEINGRRVDAGNVYEISNIRENINAVAIFERNTVKIKVVSDNDDYGTVEGGGEVPPGSEMTLRAKPRDGYSFRYWERDGEKYSNDEKIKITNLYKDYKFVAYFDREKYVVKASVTPDGAGQVSGTGEYKKGKDVTLTANPSKDYKFKSWMKDGKVLATTDSIVIKEISKDQSITAVFEHKTIEPKTYTIEGATTSSDGVITPAGKMPVGEGGGLTYTITPRAGYSIKQVAVDGRAVGPVSSYTFTNVRENHNIVAAFEKLPVIFEPTNGDGKNQNNQGNKQPQNNPQNNNQQSGQGNKHQNTRQSGPNTTQGTDDKKPDGGSQTHANEAHGHENGGNMPEEGSHTDYDSNEDNEYVEHITEDSVLDEMESHASSDELAKLSVQGGALQQLDIDQDKARLLIKSDKDEVLMNTAIINDDVTLVVNNTFSKSGAEAGREGDVSATALDNGTFRQFSQAARDMLSEDEKISAYNGEHVSISLNIIGQGGYTDTGEQRDISKKLPSGSRAEEFFAVNLLKISKGEVENLTELRRPIEITIDIPDKLKGRGAYRIARNHNGNVDILEDLDNDPDTITFRSDRFSTYAIVTDGGIGIMVFVIAGMAALTALIIVGVVAVKLSGRKRQ